MLKQVGSAVVAGIVGAMSVSAQGTDNPNYFLPLALTGGAFFGAQILFSKLEPDLSIPPVRTPSASSSSSSSPSQSSSSRGGKGKGKKDNKKGKKDTPAQAPAPVVEDEEVVVEEAVDEEEEVEEEKPAAKANKKKKGKKDNKKEKVEEKPKAVAAKKKDEKKGGAPAVAEPKKEQKKGAANDKKAPQTAAKKEEKKPAAAKKEEKKPAAAAKKEQAAPKKAVEEKKPAKKDDKKKGKKAVEEKKREDSENDTDEVDDDGWTSVARPQSKKAPKEKESSSSTQSTEEKKVINKITEIAVAHTYYGAILGQGGQVLAALQQKTGARVTVPKQGSVIEKIKIEGSIEAVRNAQMAIEDIVKYGYSQATHPGWDDAEIKFENDGQKVAVIGNEGATLRALQDKFKVRINMPSKGSPKQSGSIIGAKADIKLARQAIEDIKQNGYSPVINPDFISRSVPFPRSALPRLIGTRGSVVKSITKQSGAFRINTPKSDDEEVVTVIGRADNVDTAVRAIEKLLEPEQPLEPEDAWTQQHTSEDELWA